MDLLRYLCLLLFGIFLHLAVTLAEVGSVFVVRAAILFFFNFDIVDFAKKLKPKKEIKKTKQILNEDKEWLKTRGRD